MLPEEVVPDTQDRQNLIAITRILQVGFHTKYAQIALQSSEMLRGWHPKLEFFSQLGARCLIG